MSLLQALYIGDDVQRPDRGQRHAAVHAPGEVPAAGASVGPTGVRVADVGRLSASYAEAPVPIADAEPPPRSVLENMAAIRRR